MLCSSVGGLNFIKMWISPSLICIFNAIPIKILAGGFIDRQIKSKIYIEKHRRGTWVAQLVELWALDFCSCHDLTVVRLSPVMGSVLTGRNLLGILSVLSLPFPCLCFLSLSLKINKINIFLKSTGNRIVKTILKRKKSWRISVT